MKQTCWIWLEEDLLRMFSVLKYGVQWQRSSLQNIYRKKTPKKKQVSDQQESPEACVYVM